MLIFYSRDINHLQL